MECKIINNFFCSVIRMSSLFFTSFFGKDKKKLTIKEKEEDHKEGIF